MAIFLDIIFRPRRGRRSTAVRKNFVLRRGEIFFEVPETGIATGPGRIVMGDGEHVYSELPYFSEDAGDVKADKVVNAVEGHLAGLDNTGNLTDSGIAPANLLIKLTDFHANDIAIFDNEGNIADCGVPFTTISRKADKIQNPVMGNLLKQDNVGNLADTGIAASVVTDNQSGLAKVLDYYNAKNILKYPYSMSTPYIQDGVSFSAVRQCIMLNGTAPETDCPSFTLANSLSVSEGSYIISGEKDANTHVFSDDFLYLVVEVFVDGNTLHSPDDILYDYGGGVQLDVLNDTTVINVIIQTAPLAAYSNTVVYPMMRFAEVKDATYAEYVKTNKQLTENLGYLPSLSTTNKTNIVNAINEINTGVTNKTLQSLTDVNINNPSNTQALVYDQASQKWINATAIPSIATVNSVGTVKPDGSTITIDADGTIHGAAAPYVVQSTAPSNTKIFWVDTSRGGVLKYWNGSSWQIIKSVWS